MLALGLTEVKKLWLEGLELDQLLEGTFVPLAVDSSVLEYGSSGCEDSIQSPKNSFVYGMIPTIT